METVCAEKKVIAQAKSYLRGLRKCLRASKQLFAHLQKHIKLVVNIFAKTMKSDAQLQVSREERDQYDLVARLLRMKEACEGWFGGKNNPGRKKLLDYLKKHYNLDIPSTDQLGKIMRQDEGSGFYSNQNNKKKWRDFVSSERDKIISKMYIKGQFSGVANTFDFQSAFNLIDAAEEAEKCVFWNTYIDMDEWHSPLIQMHLCIQKSIEQKNNFAAIHGCHNLAGNQSKRGKAITACTNNPPVYRHYRILILPLTEKEFSDRLGKRDSFYENLRFSTLMHCSLSIQLAVLSITQLAMIFLQDKSDFFTKEENLKVLGLNTSLASLLKGNNTVGQIETLLKENLEGKGNIPDSPTEIGMDFLHIHRVTEKVGQKNFWSAYDDSKGGLTYYNFENEEFIKVKKKFSEIVFNAITETLPPAKLDLMKLDPIYPFYEKDRKREFANIIAKYNAKNKVELNS